MKKQYITPLVEAMKINAQSELLAGSSTSQDTLSLTYTNSDVIAD